MQPSRPTGVGVVCALALAVALAACGSSEAPTVETPVGNVSFALELPDGSDIENVEYDVTLTFLESKPPETYLFEQYSTEMPTGELTAVLPCHTKASGTGMNQVDIVARIKVKDIVEPLVARSSAVFTCRRNADTLVNVTISVISAYNLGFMDLDVVPIGTLCNVSVGMQSDTSRGVCTTSLCNPLDDDNDQARDVFVFRNTCQALQAANPTFWICGSPADWQVTGMLANASFPLPEHDGTWSWGVAALDAYQMAQVDPTLTDENGNLTVWTGVSVTRSTLRVEDGNVVQRDGIPGVFEFAADLELAPLQVGLPAVHTLLVVNNEAIGARVAYQTKFGPCDVPTRDVSLYAGSPVIDVRRDGNTAVSLILANPGTGFATLIARCETAWDTSGAAPQPSIVCGPPLPLIPDSP